MKWKRISKGYINEPLEDYLIKIFEEEMGKGYDLTVCIGTDSKRRNGGYQFATALIIKISENIGNDKFGRPIHQGKGGIVMGANYFDQTLKKGKDGVKERMLIEVAKTIEVAYEIAPLLDLYGVKLEIHADVNPDVRWESNKAFNEAVGYMIGMGYDFKVKPDAWAASTGADKLC
ncbi:MAG: ribonuclease H-like YkuK family protein [Methanobacterium sp.]